MKSINRVIFYVSFPLSFVAFIFPIYASSIGVKVLEIGLLYSVFTVMTLLIRPIVGYLIEKSGRKPCIFIGVILYTIVNVIYLFANSFSFLLAARVIQGFAASFLWISIDTYVSDISNDSNRAKNFGIMYQAGDRGELIGSIIGFSILFGNYGNNPFKLVFFLYFITGLLSLYHTKGVAETKDIRKETINTSKNTKTLKYFIMIMSIISLVTSLSAPIFLLYLQEFITDDLSMISLLFLPGAIFSIFLPKIFGIFADNHCKEKIIFSGLLTNAFLIVFIPFIVRYYPFVLFYTLITVVNMFYGPALSSIIIDYVGTNKRGRTYGYYRFGTGIGSAAGTLIGAYIYEYIGKRVVFILEGVILCIIVIIIYFKYNRYIINKIGMSMNEENREI